MGKGNIAIDKSMIKTIVDGKIIIPLPKVLVGNRYYPMFSIFSPTQCDSCGSKLHVNSHHTRFIISRYGTISLSLFNFFWFFFNLKTTTKFYPNLSKSIHSLKNVDSFTQASTKIFQIVELFLWEFPTATAISHQV
ncbi:hypothetical protein [Methanosarcina acetivorans]|uniref:Uncharacterized protein n=1 Tax=Methanosarcina acetivorans (strain ATCC 35395 / DSM 2834 / JCM 12185 / C2A) TaxID=188937 RepID=Q8TIL3_METAC|nr:hypothetical protein [Methanosarcina acetivorans]AAM07484.1 predicted protein [Methanosarcina acetivorans C2A]